MTYTTVDILTAQFGVDLLIGLTDRATQPLGVIDATVIDNALAATDAVIDGHLGVRYSLPLVAVPKLISDLATSIAIYKLHTYEPDPKIGQDYKDAMATLKGISAGTVKIPVAGIEPAGTGGTGAQMTDRERPMTAANLKGFI